MSGKRVIKALVVDDEKIIRDFLIRLFTLEGVEAEAVEDGFTAIEMVKQKKFDMVFLDVRMPKVDGFEVFKELKKVMPGAKYIMMTGYAVDDLLSAAQKEGAIASLKKPFEIEEIRRLLANA
ncbi:MAG: response regulator [Candidatus Omnitrophica bacterium]|nr:response regulator [Candidatus Omnitrophota bacterium]